MPAGISSRASAGGDPPLADEQEAAVVVEREDGDRARVADDVALAGRAVGALDGVDAELEVVPAVDDVAGDDALGERIVGGVGVVGHRERS